MVQEEHRADQDQELQSLVPAAPQRTLKENLENVAWLLAWVVVSSAIILNSKWVFSTGGFPHPLALTCLHMVCCLVVFGGIRHLAPSRIALTIMPDAEKAMSWDSYAKKVLTIALLFGLSLGAGQQALLFASVPFCQMMKPLNCVIASLAGFAVGVEIPTYSHMIIVSMVFLGVSIATYSSAEYSMAGFLLQLLATLAEGTRLACLQRITTCDDKVDPVTTVYYYSFPAAVILACATYAVEWPVDFSKLLSPWVLIINCSIAVVLNILIATVIKKVSAVVFTLAGICKDLGIIFASTLIFHNTISRMTMCGYAVALYGIFTYKNYKDNFELFQQRGFISAMSVLAERGLNEVKSGASKAMQSRSLRAAS